MRIGQSTDIHQFAENRKLILGGVEIPFEKGLMGNSDADALTHAVAEAILGALALGDLGHWFPDQGPEWKDASSLDILSSVVGMMEERGYRIGNLDSLILIERPKMAPYIETMRANFARILHCPLDCVSVKATRGEKMGFVGHEEGVMAQAVVLLEENNA